jgi:carbamoyltransferase
LNKTVLGISALYHDSAAALCSDGEIIAAAQEERFTRIKHDAAIPVNAIAYCLREAGLAADELDAVVYYDNPFLTLDRFLHNLAMVEHEQDADDLLNLSFEPLFRERLWVHEHLKSALPPYFAKNGKLLAANHHVSHAASAFYPSPFESAAIITLDGVGEWATTTIGRGAGAKIELLKEINYPHSLGLLYSALSYFCGFKVNSGEYKFMGLAPYGEPLYYGEIMNNLVDVKEDGSYKLNLDYFDYHNGRAMVNENFAALFHGPKREFESAITKREMDIAASAQKALEEIVILIARHTAQVTEEKNLVLAGGVALNCVANGKLRREGIFDDIWVQPAAGDAGGALGAALYVSFAQLGVRRKTKPRGMQKGSFLGPSYSAAEIKAVLDQNHGVYHEYADISEQDRALAQLLAEKNVIGFFSGRMEFGPRALGARSILADPRDKEMQAKLNLKIKYRESFRPFAPAVLAEKTAEYFEMDYESPYMLFVAGVCQSRRKPFAIREHVTQEQVNLLPIVSIERSDIPAVTHVDYSARVQSVHQDDNPRFHQLISAFEKITGCGAVVNTSFNVRGEPIVCTPEEAYLCFMRTDMDILVLENFVLFKKEQPEFQDHEDWRKIYELD